MDIQQKIIDLIKKNRISTTEVADALNKQGAVENVLALNRGHFKVGKVFWAYAYNGSNWNLHKDIVDIPENSVLIVETFNCDNKAVFGDLVSKYLFLYKQVSAVVVRGKLRDVPRLIKENWPIWYEGPTPIGCHNQKNNEPLDPTILKKMQDYYENAIAVCDDCGVVVITKEYHTTDFINALNKIEEQEDIWYNCLDRLKWNTFDIVCLKKYLEE